MRLLVRPPHRLDLCCRLRHTSSFVRCCYPLVAVSLLVAHADCRAVSIFMAAHSVLVSLRRRTETSILFATRRTARGSANAQWRIPVHASGTSHFPLPQHGRLPFG